MQDQQQGVHVLVATVGFAALALVWLGLVLGLVLRDGRALDRMRPVTLAALHQTTLACGLTLAAVHALGQFMVPGGAIRLIDLWTPLLGRSQHVGVGLGVVGLELTIALAVSSALRARIGHHRWRLLHRLSYVAFALLVAHVVVAGSDVRAWWLRIPIVVAAALTVGFGLATAGWVARLPGEVVSMLREGRTGSRVAIDVDATRCAHFGFCQHEAPELFKLREDGRLRHASRATRAQADAAVQAARACPTRAILLSRHAVRVVVAEPPRGNDPADHERHHTSGRHQRVTDPPGRHGRRDEPAERGRAGHAAAE